MKSNISEPKEQELMESTPAEDALEYDSLSKHDSSKQNQDSNAALTPQLKSSIFGTSSNLVNTIVGAGIVGIPYALLQCGLVAGTLLLFLVGILTEKSLRMLIDTAIFHKRFRGKSVTTFEDLMFYPFGQIGRGFILLSMFVMAYGAMVAYLIIIKDTVPTILGINQGFQPEIILVFTSALVMLPLSMQRDMASLACTSVFSVTCDVLLVFFVVIFSPFQTTVSKYGGMVEVLRHDSISVHLFVGLGILSTAMCCQHSSFLIYGSLNNNTKQRWAKVTAGSISIATIMTYTLGIAGYLGFLHYTQGDCLNNFATGSIQANLARGLLAITMFFTYPMESFVGRHVLADLIFDKDTMDAELEAKVETDNPFLNKLVMNNRQKMTLFLYIISLFPALIFDDLGPVLSLTGCVGGSCMSYIGPSMAFLGVNGPEFLKWAISLLPKAGKEVKYHVSNDLTLCDHPTIPSGPKPFWWYLSGFPVWCHIAEVGSRGMQRSLDEDEFHYKPTPDHYGAAQDFIEATSLDFKYAIFFLVFGIIALIAGLATNIYVELTRFMA